MKAGNIFIVVLVVIVITALITNPTKDEFVDYLETEFVEQSESTVEHLVSSLTKGIAGAVADRAIRENYLVFSTYELADHNYIGAFGNFWLLDKSNN